jgi:hypothetical protein
MFDAAPIRSREGWQLRLLMIFCLALLGWPPADAARRRDLTKPASPGAAGASFAIADFDGDSLPDFATVQPGLATASRTDYWIHFNFSLGSESSFAVSAPAGGLQIASRDVNGDSFPDLIISTRIANEPVAVLLNDGRGNFHFADTRAFGAGIWEARSAWQADVTGRDDHESAIAGTGWAGADCSARKCGELAPTLGNLWIASEKNHGFVVPHEVRGRAPPAA